METTDWRVECYAALAALLAEPPRAALLDALAAGSHDGAAGPALQEAWHALCRQAAGAAPAALAREYHELFIGLTRGELMPYGSWYLTGFLHEQPLARLRQDLKALGIRRRAEVREPEDHAAALCEVMRLLAEADDGRQEEFFRRHLAPWLGRFYTDLSLARTDGVYHRAGILGVELMRAEGLRYGIRVPFDPTHGQHPNAFAAETARHGRNASRLPD